MPIKISDKTIDHDFIEKVIEISGQDIYKCFQCGTCGGACPMSPQLQVIPRRIMRMVQLGQKDALAETETCWTCASCHNCSVNCPRGIDLARVMEALRLINLRKSNVDHVNPSELSAETVEGLPQIAMVSCFRKMTS